MAAPKNEHGLTPKQEAFVRAFFECGNAAEAYRQSYDVEASARDSWIYVEACQLLDNPNVTQRLETLRAEAEKASIYNLTMALGEYEQARQLAMIEKNPSAAVSAITGKAKLFGLEKPQRMALGGDKDAPPIRTEEVSARDLLKAHIDAIASRNAVAPE